MATASKRLLNAPTGPRSQNLSLVLTAFVVDQTNFFLYLACVLESAKVDSG